MKTPTIEGYHTFEAREYQLHPQQLMNVVAHLERYIHHAVILADRQHPDRTTPSVGFRGEGRKMVVHGEYKSSENTLQGCDLAELVLSADAQRLTLKVLQHDNATIDPTDLYFIAAQYAMKKETTECGLDNYNQFALIKENGQGIALVRRTHADVYIGDLSRATGKKYAAERITELNFDVVNTFTKIKKTILGE
jgi:hypothetical protein